MSGMGGYMMVPVPTPFYRGGRGRTFRYSYFRSTNHHSKYQPYTSNICVRICSEALLRSQVSEQT